MLEKSLIPTKSKWEEIILDKHKRHEDDTPPDASKYLAMSNEALESVIRIMENEHLKAKACRDNWKPVSPQAPSNTNSLCMNPTNKN